MFLYLLFLASSLILSFRYSLFLFLKYYPHLFHLDPATTAIWLVFFDLIISSILRRSMVYASSIRNNPDSLTVQDCNFHAIYTAVLWAVTMCIIARSFHCFWRTYCTHLQGRCNKETGGNAFHTAWRTELKNVKQTEWEHEMALQSILCVHKLQYTLKTR
jgi:hypothetical protein